MITTEKNNTRWLYTILGVTVLLFAGLIYAWSILSRPIIANFPTWSSTTLSFTFTLCMSFFCLGGLLSGILNKKFNNIKINLSLAAILFLLGFYIVSKLNSPLTLYLGYGIMAGLASGLSYNTIMTTVTAYFEDKPGLISGILLMGFGFGSFLIGKIYQRLISFGYEWRYIFFILGIILAILLILCCFILKKKEISKQNKEDKSIKEIKNFTNDVTTAEMLKKKSFWLFFIWATLLSATGLAIISQASGIIVEIFPNISESNIPTIAGFISIFNGVGRVFFGTIFDKIGRKKTMIFNEVIFFIAIFLMVMAMKLGISVLLIMSFILVGLAYGGVPTINSAFISSFFGRKYYSQNFSVVNLNILLASFGGTISAKIYDVNKSYLILLYSLIALVALSRIIIMQVKD